MAVLCVLALWGVLAPGLASAQTAPTQFDVSPSRVEQGECYTIDVGTPNITLDVKYRFNNGPSIIISNWPSIGSGGTARICTDSLTALGTYTFVEARNTLGGPWVSGGDTVRVVAPPPPNFSLTASPSTRTLGPTGSATYTVWVSPQNGFNSAVNLSASGLGSNVTASFSRSSLSSPYTSTSTLTLRTNGATAGTRSVTVNGSGGGLSRTDSVQLRIVAQPTSFRFSQSLSYAGRDTTTLTVGDGANMSLDVRYTLNGGPTRTGTTQLDANGQWTYSPARDAPTGTYVYTGMKNALLSTWVTINVSYTVRPPQPTTMSISPSTLDLPGSYTMTVGNGADMTLDVGYTLQPPGGSAVTKPDIHGWPELTAVSQGSTTGRAVINASGCTLPGIYRFTKMRNTLNAAWVTLSPPAQVTNRAPVSVTSVAPSRIVAGTSVQVTLRGEHLCALDLSTTYTGVSISNVSFDPAEGAGTRATATIEVAATALSGTATVQVSAGEGTTSFDLTIASAPAFMITAAPASRYAAPTGSAAYTVSVSPSDGFNSTVNLSASGLGSNVTASFSRSSLSSPYTSTSTLTLRTNGATAGPRSVTVNGSGGGLSRTDSVQLQVVAQPTTFRYSQSLSYAGRDTTTLTVGNGANMSLDVRYRFNGGAEETGNTQLDANGQWTYSPARDAPTGTYIYTGMKNALVPDWVTINVSYTVRPPQPATMSISPSTLDLPGNYTMTVGNGADMTLDVQYTLQPPGGTAGPVTTIENWPELTAVSQGSTDGRAVINASGCTLPGIYLFNNMRNTLNAAWVTVSATVRNRAPVSVTSVAPSLIVAGTSVRVTLTGEHLCALELSTTYAGVSISNVSFDPVEGAGTMATATIEVAATALSGTATVEVSAGEGTTSFDLTIAPAPAFMITADPAVGYAAPTGSAAYTLTVTPSNGFDQAVTLSASGLPANVMASFTPAMLTAPYSATSMLTLATDGASVGTSAVTITGTGGGLSKTDSVDLQVVAQPTSFSFSQSLSYAGRDTTTLTVGNGANMSLDVRYTLNGGEEETGTTQLDANGQWTYSPARDAPTGTYIYTGMKNALVSEWVTINVSYTVRPPQPTTMSISPSTLELPGNYTMTVGNGADMTLDVQYTLQPPGGTAGPVTTIENWPELTAVSQGSTDGRAVINASGCTLPGIYLFNNMRNTLNAAWVTVSATVRNRAPVSVTSVAPSLIVAGTSVRVTLTGEHLCALELSTTYAGVSISNVFFDPVEGAGTMATATIEVAATALSGTATVEVSAGEGTTSFDLTIAPAPAFMITADPAVGYAAPTGSAAYTLTVTPSNGFDQAVTLSASGLPANVMASFTPAMLTAPYSATSMLTLATDGASVGTSAVTITGTGGGLSKTDSVDLQVVAQPTSFSFSQSLSYAGRDTTTLTVGNGANMSLDVRYTLNGGEEETGTTQLDANGQWTYSPARDAPTGTYIYTGMKNALVSEWVTINVSYTVRPPQPTTMSISPSTLELPGNYTMTVGNGADMTLDVQYTLQPPGGTAGPVTTIENWPELTAVSQGSTDGRAVINASGCTLPGIYLFNNMRNTLNAAWVTVSATVRNRAPVSVTSVAPSLIVAGTSVRVTLMGEHLCALELSTTYAGVSISNVSFDPAEGAGTTATATIDVAATALSGTATVEVSAGEGTASFDLMIAAGSGFMITAAPAVGYAPPTGSTTYAVEVAPEMGFTQTVTLSASGLPANVMAAFTPATLTAPYQATSTLTLTTDGASVGTTAVTITGTGGGLSATTPVELRVVPQPTTYHITPEEGYVGAHTVTLTVGNGANMDLDLRYTLNGLPHTGRIPLDANGQWSYISTRADVIGTYVYTGMRNALLTEWVTIDDTYTPRPPQPTTMTMTVNPASLIPPGNYTMTVGNGAGMTLDVQYTHTPPGGHGRSGHDHRELADPECGGGWEHRWHRVGSGDGLHVARRVPLHADAEHPELRLGGC